MICEYQFTKTEGILKVLGSSHARLGSADAISTSAQEQEDPYCNRPCLIRRHISLVSPITDFHKYLEHEII